MMFPRTLTTLALTLTLALSTQLISIETADALPGNTLVKSRKSGPRTHKGRSTSAKSKKSSKSKKTTRRTTTRRTTRATPTRTTRTTTTRRGTPTRTTRTTRTTTRRSTPTRTRTTTVRSRPSTRTYHRSHRTHRTHSHHHHTHSHSRTSYYSSGYTNSSARSNTTARRSSSRAPIEGYITGGLGFSGFASDAIVDGALPGLGYNVALGAKGKLFGGEIGLNGGGYTFNPGTAPTDIGVVGLSADLKLQPSIAFFEPFVSAGIGGYALNDAVISERSAGAGVRLGAGADFRFDNIAVRAGYQWGGYAFDNAYDAYGDGGFTAKTESLSASLIVYF